MCYLLLTALVLGQDLGGHEGPVVSAAFSPNGRVLATGGKDATVILWDLETGKERRRLKGHLGTVRGVAWSGNDTVIARSYLEAAFGEKYAAGSRRAELVWWDTTTGQQLFRIVDRGCGAGSGLAVSPDGQSVASAWWINGEWVRFWESRTGIESGTFYPTPEESATVRWLSYSQDGKALAVVTEDNVLTLRELALPLKPLWVSPHLCMSRPSFSLTDNLVAVTDKDNVCRLLDVRTGQVVRQGKVAGGAFFLDGKTLATAGGGLLVLYDAETLKTRGSVQIAVHHGTNVALSADRKRLAIVGLRADRETGVVEVRDVPKLP